VSVTEERFDVVEEEEEEERSCHRHMDPSAGTCFLRWKKAGRLNFVAVKLEQLSSPP
jgi:hypothetical protein